MLNRNQANILFVETIGVADGFIKGEVVVLGTLAGDLLDGP